MKFAALVAATLCASPALGIDPGVAKGRLEVAGRAVPLTHAYAHEHDNAEGLLDGRELRILLTDRPVAQTLLGGVETAALEDLARKGRVRGVLLIVDPANPRSGSRGMLLWEDKDPARPLAGFVRGGDGGLPKLEVMENRVQGEAAQSARAQGRAFRYSASFSAPLFREEPLTGRHTGTHAIESAPFRALAEHARALREGDFEAARKWATRRHTAELDALIAKTGRAEAAKRMKEAARVPGADDQPRVFVRGASALIVYQTSSEVVMQATRLVDGRWLVD